MNLPLNVVLWDEKSVLLQRIVAQVLPGVSGTISSGIPVRFHLKDIDKAVISKV